MFGALFACATEHLRFAQHASSVACALLEQPQWFPVQPDPLRPINYSNLAHPVPLTVVDGLFRDESGALAHHYAIVEVCSLLVCSRCL